MTDAEKKRKGLGLAEGLLQAADCFEHEFQHRELAQEARHKAIGVYEAMRHMGILSKAEFQNRMFMLSRRTDEKGSGVRMPETVGRDVDALELLTEGRAG